MRVVMHRLPRSGVAVLTTAVAALSTLLLSPLSVRVPFALFAAAVIVSSLEGGLKPGLLATALATVALAVEYWLLPFAQLSENQGEVIPLLILFVMVGLLSSYLGQRCWHAVHTVERQPGIDFRHREERFRALAACAPIGILQMDPQSRCIYANCSCQLTGGFSVDESLGDGWTRFLHADDRDRVVPAWTRAMEAGKEFACEFRFQTPQQNGRWVCLRSSPMYSDRGKVIGHVGVVQDIGDRKLAEEALRETLMLVSASAGEAAEPLLVKNVDSRVLLTNSAGVRLIGNLMQEVRERKCQADQAANTDQAAELTRAICSLREETLARQRAEERLREAETRLRTREARLADLAKTNAILQQAVRERDRALEEFRREKEIRGSTIHGSANGGLRSGKRQSLEVY